jgi:hypothetical protein
VQITVLRSLRKGGYAEGWDTNPGTSWSVLGVVYGGHRLNRTDREVRLAVPSHRRLRLELYANDQGVFTPGQLYRVEYTLSDRTVVKAEARLPGARATLAASFAGRSEDVVGRGIDQAPNRELDGRFTLRLDTHGGWRILEDVSIRRLLADGTPDAPICHLQGPVTVGVFVAAFGRRGRARCANTSPHMCRSTRRAAPARSRHTRTTTPWPSRRLGTSLRDSCIASR